MAFLFLSIYTPKYGTLDRMSTQYFLLSITNFLAIVSVPLVFNLKHINFTRLYKNPLLISYSFVLLISALSFIKSINITESFVELNQQVSFFLTLVILTFLIMQNLINKKIILWIVFMSLIIDLSFSLYPIYTLIENEISLKYSLISNFVGLAGNRNILAISILFRIPLIIYFALEVKNKGIKTLSFILLIFSFLSIFILSSRASLLGIIILSLFFFFLFIFKVNSVDKNQVKRIGVLFFLPLLISYIISTNVIENTDKADVSSRIASISSTTDESINSRLRYWSHATDFIYKNPFLGGGIGNWRIYSIKYDSAYIKSYIVPYSAHNDLLEFTAETGIIGGLIFLSFFVILFLLIIKTSGIFSEKFDFKIGFILISSFLIYFLDLNLNFPTSRPLNLFLLLMLISLTTILLNKMNDKI